MLHYTVCYCDNMILPASWQFLQNKDNEIKTTGQNQLFLAGIPNPSP